LQYGYSHVYVETYVPHILTNVCDDVYQIKRQRLGDIAIDSEAL
jgi:hypothetical protein